METKFLLHFFLGPQLDPFCVEHPDRGLPRWLAGKESACQAGDAGLTPGLGRCPGGGPGNPLQYSCLGNPWTEGPGGVPSMELQRVGHG